MRTLWATICIFLLLGCDSEFAESYDLVIANVSLIDGVVDKLQAGVSIGIREGKIVEIRAGELTGGKVQVDGTGKYLIPGLFDCHIHTTDYEADFPRFIHYGVTSVFITGGSRCTDEYYAAMRKQGNQDSIPAPIVFHTSRHFTMEGRHPSKTYPSGSWQDGRSIFYLTDTAQISRLVEQVSHSPISGIKLTIEDGPAPPFVDRIPQAFVNQTVREARRYELEVFAHVSDNIELEMAIRAGVQNLVHFTGVDLDLQDEAQLELLDQLFARNPDWITTLSLDKSFLYPLHPEWFHEPAMLPEYQEMEHHLTTWDTRKAQMYQTVLMETFNSDELSLSSFSRPQVEQIKFLQQNGVNMVLGTDTGNRFIFPGYGLHEEMQLLESGGMDRMEILKMGTIHAAKMLHAQDSLGSIEVGKLANFVLLEENPLEDIRHTLEIDQVIKRGVVQRRLSVSYSSQD